MGLTSEVMGLGSCFIIMVLRAIDGQRKTKGDHGGLKRHHSECHTVLRKHLVGSAEYSDVKMICLQKHGCFLLVCSHSLPNACDVTCLKGGLCLASKISLLSTSVADPSFR